MRIAFTIIHNGLHHLKHNEQAERILRDCDWWKVLHGQTAVLVGARSFLRTFTTTAEA